MIYTVTFNPSLDYIVEVPKFELGRTNRTTQEQTLPGGKGINVSIVLKNLGHDSVALGFLAGYVGEEIKRRMDGITSEFIEAKNGVSRINVKLKNIDGTEINGCGPEITQEEIKDFFHKIDKIQDGDLVVLGGSVPKNISADIYMDILEKLPKARCVVDATGELLVNSLKYNPFLIKPNIHELEEIFQVNITEETVVEYAKKLQEKGARNVLVSKGGKGAVLLDEHGKYYESSVPKGTLINAVGSGDSMVAGFISGYLEKKDYEYAFKKAVATGSASAFSEQLATKEEVMDLLKQLES